jgi:predicted transcriptional regulator
MASEATSRAFSVRLPVHELEHLDELTRLTKRSRNSLIAQAVERYVAEELAFIQASTQILDEALDPHAVLIPHAAVRAWLETWGTPEETAALATLDGDRDQAETRTGDR